MSIHLPVGNGLRTDHPIPDLPFVDDSHLPLADPVALEQIGRNQGPGRWGREDQCRDGGWAAFTTDPTRTDLAWCVRWHPEHGRSVILYRDQDAAAMHMLYAEEALLFRAGGYWWDGSTWFRPAQVWDRASEKFVRRPVPAALSVSAADLLPEIGANPGRGQVISIEQVDVDAGPPANWLDDLALWAARRPEEDRSRQALAGCVVKLAAPELTGDQLVGVTELAQIGGIAASTLRAYLSRGQSDVPAPQATVSGRSVWARPVAQEWAEQRARDSDSVTAAVSRDLAGAESASVPQGIAEATDFTARMFFARLWENPARRKRWALRWRSEDAVRALAQELGWAVAASLDKLVPAEAMPIAVQHAVLHEIAQSQQRRRLIAADQGDDSDVDDPESAFYGINPQVARMLDWLIRHQPRRAAHTIGELTGEAQRLLGVHPIVTERSLRIALNLDSKLDASTRDDFLTRVFTPATNG